jgi:hypothetical protein
LVQVNVVPFTWTMAPSGEQAKPSRAPGVNCGDVPAGWLVLGDGQAVPTVDGLGVLPVDGLAATPVDGLGVLPVDGFAATPVDGQAVGLAAAIATPSGVAILLIPQPVSAIVAVSAAMPIMRVFPI